MGGVEEHPEQRLALWAAVVAGAALRLLPTLWTAAPFSVDSWGPLRDAEVFYGYSPVPLVSKLFDNYNNYWPALPVFLAVVGKIYGLKPVEVGPLIAPLVSALGLPIAYAVVKRLGLQGKGVAAVLFACFFNSAWMGGGITKEGFAGSLFYSLLLSVLIGGWYEVIVLSAALALAHHLTTLVATAALLSLSVVRLAEEASRGGARVPARQLLALVVAGALQYLLLGRYGLGVEVSWDLLVSAAAYLTLASLLASWTVVTANNGGNRFAYTVLSFLAFLTPPAISWLAASGVELLSGSPSVSTLHVFYSLAYSLLVLLATTGWPSRAEPLAFLAGVLGLLGFAVFSDPPGAGSIAYRLTSFAYPFLVMLAAARASRWRRVVATAVIVINMVMYALTFTGVDIYTGWYWLYSPREVKMGYFISAYSPPGVRLAADAKMCSLVRGMYGINCIVGSSRGLSAWELYDSVMGFPVEGARVLPPVPVPKGNIIYTDLW
ncbi:MAG: hypothetical protein ABWK01_06280, partial [Infirmifilum sp.]